MHNFEIEDALGAAQSYLHALKMAIESCKALGGGGKDYCALHLLADAADDEIKKAFAVWDSIGHSDSQPVEDQPVNNVDNGGN